MKELWYVSCSPRNPAKIRPEVALLKQLEGADWNAADENGKKITQLKFAELLATNPDFEGKISTSEPAFSARDRVAPMKTYGFAYVDSTGKIRITNAGDALISSINETDVFMKQLLKWQYPSYQHCGAEYEGGDPDLFAKHEPYKVFPFLLAVKIARMVSGLTKKEVAIFLLPHHTMQGLGKLAKRIKQYRLDREKRKGRVAKKRFELETHFKVYKEVYDNYLQKIRNRREKVEKLKKKVRNSIDVADACMRLFRHTGIFTPEKTQLVLNPTRAKEIDTILQLNPKPVSFFRDVDRFYEYFGDPDLPKLPFESKPFLEEKILHLQKLIQQIPVPSAAKLQEKTAGSLKPMSEAQLKTLLARVSEKYKAISNAALKAYLQSEDGHKDVLEFFADILEGDVVDPPTYFEWNMWRALIAIDEAKYILPNLQLDENQQPMNCAPGNKPDLVMEFENCLIPVEVTLAAGRRQCFTESEPVTYHVGKCKIEESKGKGRPVIGLFVAPTLNPHTVAYFYAHIQDLEVPGTGHVTVIPWTLEMFTDIFRFANSLKYLKSHQLSQLLVKLEANRKVCNGAEQWLTSFKPTIEMWKQEVLDE